MTSRGSLFRRYAALIVSLVGIALITSGSVSSYFSYQELRSNLFEMGQEKARAAAIGIEQYVKDIERQIGWTSLPSVGADGDTVAMRQLDFLKLMKQVPAISEVSEVDANGRERIRVSRFLLDALESGKDRSSEPGFIAALDGNVYFGPVYFHKETEPYMSIAVRSRKRRVTIVEVNLKFIWEVISEIRVGQSGVAYLVGRQGKLVAHPDISLVLKQLDMTHLQQVHQAMEEERSNESGFSDKGRNIVGEPVLTAYARVDPLDWRIFVEQPRSAAYAPLYISMLRNGAVLFGGLVLAVIASSFLARRMVRPIQVLREAAEALGTGKMNQRIEITSGDELQELAEQFNNMSQQLADSHAGLETKVEKRTAELAAEQAKSRSLLRNILPETVIDELTETNQVRPVRHEDVTILFTDFVGFTEVTSTMPADRMVAELNEIFAAFDDIVYEEKVEKIKTIGDAYMAASGLLDDTSKHAHRCVRAALRFLDYLDERNRNSAFKWQLRVGVHSGPVVSGVVGKNKYAFDIWGDTVNIASRMESSGEVGHVNISAYTFHLIRDSFDCEYRGKISAKGKGDVDMYFVKGAL